MIRIEVGNIREFEARFNGITRKLIPELNRAIKKAAHLIEYEAKLIVPWDTGDLRKSIRPSFQPLKTIVQPNVDYAIYVHEGPGQPRKSGTVKKFMKVGAEKATPAIKKAFDVAVKNALRKL